MKKGILLIMIIAVAFCNKGYGQYIATEIEPNNYEGSANTMVLGSFASNQARDSGCHINPAGDVDFYKIKIPSSGVLSIYMPPNATGITYDITITDSATNTELYYNYAQGAPFTSDILVCGGTVYIEINAYWGSPLGGLSTFSYGLNATFNPDVTECNNTEAEAYVILPNDSITAYLRGFNNTISGGLDVDYYKVHTSEGGVLSINIPVNSTGITFYIGIIDSATNTVLNYGWTTAPWTLEALTCGGTYYIYVYSYTGIESTIPYVLNVHFYPDVTECNNNEADAFLLHNNDTVTAYIRGYNSTLTGSSADRDWYKIVNTGCGLLTGYIPANATSIDFELSIIDSATGITLRDATSGEGGAVTDTVSVVPGTYYIYVGPYMGPGHGSATNADANPYILYVNLTYPEAGTISGGSSVCIGSVISLADGLSGGTWSSVFGGIGSISTSGVFTGLSIGTDTIHYSIINTCGTATATKVINVITTPVAGTISGSASVCTGSSITLTDGVSGGVWSESNSNATVSGGVVTGVASGTDIISYSVTNLCGTAYSYVTVTVNVSPSTITLTGPSSVCIDTEITLSASTGGGSWSASNSNAVVTGGVVTGLASGTDIINYIVSNSCGTVSATKTITINPLPDAGTISGSTVVCVGSNITLTDTATGGIWSAENGNVLITGGTVTGIATGSDLITYTIINSCGTAHAVQFISIDTLPDAGAITGMANECVGSVITLSDGISGGTWSCGTPSVASITSSTGYVTGSSAGTALISYSVTNTCGTGFTTIIVTVNPLPEVEPITGNDSVCLGNSISLNDATTGGTWNNITLNTLVSTTGNVTGVSPGPDTVTYTISTATCGDTTAFFPIYVLQENDCNTGVQIIPVSNDGLEIFPNPNDGTFIMTLTCDKNVAVTVNITNLVGKTVKSYTTSANQTIEISLLQPTGVYFLTATTQNSTFTQKIIIQ